MSCQRINLRPTRGADLPAIRQIQARGYADLPPDRFRAMRSRLRAGGAACVVAERRRSVVGHVQALPWPTGHVLQLDERIGSTPADADSLFVYEVVVDPALQGRGLAQRLMAHVHDEARRRGLSRLALVAYGQAAAYWLRLGFHPHPLRDAPARAALASYGGQGQYLVKPLDLPGPGGVRSLHRP